MNDLLSPISSIVDRLKEKVPGVDILPAWGLPLVKETHDLPPSIMVFLESYSPGRSTGNGHYQEVELTFSALIVIHDREQSERELILSTVRALTGWNPGVHESRPFRWIPSSFKPDHSQNGIFYFPLSFSTIAVIHMDLT